jgi:hypothetical protein
LEINNKRANKSTMVEINKKKIKHIKKERRGEERRGEERSGERDRDRRKERRGKIDRKYLLRFLGRV